MPHEQPYFEHTAYWECHPSNVIVPSVVSVVIISRLSLPISSPHWRSRDLVDLPLHTQYCGTRIRENKNAKILNLRKFSTAKIKVHTVWTMHSFVIYHHPTVQVARVPVQCLHQWLDARAPPAQVSTSDATTCASGVFASMAEWKYTTIVTTNIVSCNGWIIDTEEVIHIILRRGSLVWFLLAYSPDLNICLRISLPWHIVDGRF